MSRFGMLLTLFCIGLSGYLAAADAPPLTISGPQVDPKVLAPLTAEGVPWAAGDRILIVGDQLAAPNQPELAVRLQEALASGRPGLDVTVRSLQNTGIGSDDWKLAALAEIKIHPPKVIAVLTGLGDALAAQAAKAVPPSADVWRKNVTEIVAAAQAAGAAAVIATPAILGDKPTGGALATELDAYADAARAAAVELKVELCDLRTPLLALLGQKNAKGAREIGVLSKTLGQLKPEGMDLVAGAVAQALANAATRIPWTVEVAGTGPFTGAASGEIRTPRIGLDKLSVYYTTDGSEPTEKTRIYTKPFPISSTTQVKVLATAKGSTVQHSAEGWFLEIRKRAADPTPVESLPGLWVDHVTLKKWRDPMPPVDTLKPDGDAWWPNCEIEAIDRLPTHRWPNTLFGLRFTGWFLAPLDGVYVFGTTSDDASRLSLGDVAVIKNDDLHPVRSAYGAVELTKGYHPFTLLYAQGPSLYTLSVTVSLPGQREQKLPDLLLRRPPVKPARKSILTAEPADEAEPPPAPPAK